MGFLTFLAVRVPVVGAYYVGATDGYDIGPIGNPPNFGELLAPVQNFFQSIGSINTDVIPQVGFGSGTSLGPTSPLVLNWIQGVLRQFDGWLYGIAGFHIIAFFAAMLGIFSWLLGLIKSGVDWLLGII